MLEYLQKPELIFILFAIVLSVLLLIKSKKLISLFITIFMVICGGVLIAAKLLEINLPSIASLSFELIIDIICALGLIINEVLLFKKGSSEKLFDEALTTLDKNVIAYLSKDGKLLNFTKNLYEELSIEPKNNLKDEFDIYLNSHKIEYQDLLTEFKENDGNNFKVTFVSKSELEDFEEISFNLQKIAIEKEDKLFGYVIVALENEIKENAIDGFSLVIDELKIPYAYYNDDSKNVVYTMNNSFKELLGIRGRTVTYAELRYLVFPEDLVVFDRAASIMAEDNTYTYRMKTSNGYKLFSEVKLTKDEHVTSIITLSDNKDEMCVSKTEIESVISKYISDKKQFAGVIVSINGFVEVFNNYGADVAKELRDKYLGYLKSETLGEKDMICRISDIEYLLLFDSTNDVDEIVRDLNNNVSTLVHYEFKYGEATIETNNTLGIVYANPSIENVTDFMHSLDNALAFANTEGYDKAYSIYNYSSKLSKENVSKVVSIKDYSFEDIKISLDNSFLDDDDEL